MSNLILHQEALCFILHALNSVKVPCLPLRYPNNPIYILLDEITLIQIMHGPTTRANARQLNLQVRSHLVNCILELTLCGVDVLMIRNLREGHQGLEKCQDVKEDVGGKILRPGGGMHPP
jgi:hypothetical protein